jgi:hypothetical protein
MTGEKPKYSEKNPSQCQFVSHKSHTGSNAGFLVERSATNRLSHGTAVCLCSGKHLGK